MGALARRALENGWIDALPVPAALIRPLDRGNFRLHASNAAFDRLDLSPTGASTPVELRRAVEQAAEGYGAQEFSCRLGEGVAARDLRGFIEHAKATRTPLTFSHGNSSPS